MSLIRRYLTGFRGVDTDAPGLFEKDDGTSWYRKPDGSEVEIGNGGDSPLLLATTTLVDADIKALPSSPFELVAAQGPNTVILLKDVLLHKNFAGGYTNCDFDDTYLTPVIGDDDLESLEQSYNLLGGFHAMNSLLSAAGESFAWFRYQSPLPGGGFFSSENFPTACVNAPAFLYVENSSHGDFAGGDAANNIKVFITYIVADVS